MERIRRRAWCAALVLAVALPVATIGSTADPVGAAGGFSGLAPARLWDTRSGPGITTIDGADLGTGRLGPGGTFRLVVAGRGGVPASGASAVVVNVTAIDPTEPSFVTVYPAGTQRPNASNLNTDAGRTLPNVAIVPLPANGAIDIFNAAGSTDLAIDVLGWFASGGGFTGLTPARVWESRSGPGLATVDGRFLGTGPLGPGATARIKVAGRGGVPAGGAVAVALNVTAIAPSAASFITIFPGGAARPNASNLNTEPGRTLPNMVVVPLSAGGEIDVFNAAGATDIAIDVLGWFSGSTDAMRPLSPGRIWETRAAPGLGTADGQQQGTGRLGADASFRLQVTGRSGVPPTGVGAVALNVTAIAPDAPSFITVHPSGTTLPTASNLNTAPGRTIPNMVIVPVSADGAVDIYNAAGTTDVAVDVLGWFPGVAVQPPAYRGRLYLTAVVNLGVFDFARSQELVGPEVIDRSTDFAVNATGTEMIYGVDEFPQQRVVIADADTGDILTSYRFTGTTVGESLVMPSPDGTRYATIISDRTDVFGPTQLVIHDRAGRQVDFLDNTRSFQWAPDGSIVLIADPLDTGTASLYVIPTTGPARTLATFDREFDDLPTDIAVSPDMSVVVYADQAAMYALPYAGGAVPRRIVESSAQLGEPTFSPDGRFLALSRDGDSGFLLKCDAVYIVPVLPAGSAVFLVGGETDPFLLRSANGTRVTSCGVGMRWT